MISSLIIVLCLSLVTPVDGWIMPSKTTRYNTALRFVPATKSEDPRVAHRDEVEGLVIIHKDTDEAEKFFEDARNEFEELQETIKNEVGLFTSRESNVNKLQQETPRRMRTPKEDHFLFTALDSWKKMPEVLDRDHPEELHWDSWPLLGI